MKTKNSKNSSSSNNQGSSIKVSDLDIPAEIKKDYLDSGIKELNPPQRKAVKAGLMDGEDMIVAAPTASGKTFIAELAMVNQVVKEGGKAVYIVPLKALASEKYQDFSERYQNLDVRMSIGDLDNAGEGLETADIVIVTSEKLDSMLRHNPSWIHEINLVITDEIHLLTSKNRGPTLEVTLTRLRELLDFQMLGLSATISNSNELADWLNAELVESDYRPVTLQEGIYQGNEIEFYPEDYEPEADEENQEEKQGSSPTSFKTGSEIKDKEEVEKETETVFIDDVHGRATLNLLKDTMEKEKQTIIFCSSRKGAEKSSDRCGKVAKEDLSRDEKQELDDYADRIRNVLGSPTSQCKRLAENVRKGAAFHHAGAVNEQRQLVEEAFKKGLIRSVSATPTLCLSKDTEIWMEGEDKTVDSVSDSDEIYTLREDNELDVIAPDEVVENLNNSELIEIESVSGRSIKLTPNHEIPIKRDGTELLIPAEEACKDDKIATVRKLDIHKNKRPELGDFVLENNLPIENRSLTTEDFYLIGAMLGDGYSGAEKKGKNIRYKGSADFANSEPQLIEHIENICRSFNLEPRFREANTTDHLVISKHKWFREFLYRSGVKKGVNKHVAPELFKAEKDEISNILKGLFDTDGWVNSNKCIGFSNISKQLIKDIQKLLLRFGIVSRVRKREGKPIEIEGRNSYPTKDHYELTIKQSKCIRIFKEEIGFGLKTKQNSLENLVESVSTIHYKQCTGCKYKIYKDLFSGRTKAQKKWGSQKKEVIQFLGKNGETGSNQIEESLGFLPRKNESRLNHHYEFIEKRRIGDISSTEWFWSLNTIGEWLYDNVLSKHDSLDSFFSREKCPICEKNLETKLRGNHRSGDFDGDIFWDKIREIKTVPSEKNVYDVVLPERPRNKHLFAANGFLVHNSAGINMPAYRVINRDLKRYTGNGMEYIPILEYEQQCGRAGRPKYDDHGEAISLAKNPGMKEEVRDRFVLGEPERLQSKLAAEPILRMHTLSLIASSFCTSMDQLYDFYEKTFYAHQFGDFSEVKDKIESVVLDLQDYGFLDEDLNPTKVGKRVSELYIDPDSAHMIIESLEKAEEKETRPISYLFMLSMTTEMLPRPRVKNDEWDDIQQALHDAEPYLLESVPNEWDPEHERFMEGIKNSLMMRAWISEVDEDTIMDKYGIAPGGIRAKMRNADWLIYGSKELARMKDIDVGKDLEKMRLRMQHGIKEELLPLVSYDQIGRVRARKLHDHGIRDKESIREVSFEKLKKLIGDRTAKKLKKQVGEENIFDRENIMDYFE